MEFDADTAVRSAAQDAAGLVSAMPRLVLEARRIAASVYHGLHGRRRAGTGENFWQYRRFMDGEPSSRVDWRRSARDDHLYVREREWEAAHTVWIWADLSASMVFASPLVWETKRDRALVVAFALAELLVKGGERVGIPGVMRPSASRRIVEKMAESLVHAHSLPDSLPPAFSPSPLAEVVLLGDFWSPTAEVVASLAGLAASGARGHVVQVCDPAEETFPFSGRVEFREPETGTQLTIGRAETVRAEYVERVAAHRATLRHEAERRMWSFIVHRTDRPASELLLGLHARMSNADATFTPAAGTDEGAAA
ncbi:DUF58 domain-containing protein [Ancylobacter mangrovi]|uniref:DUF58 domain-containing protein n=1 Tax=Ancylobacter mangrovi TaxID=2972472 RepID=A0A9X2T2I6_9HYPH|nr:DUF58 domain-containing protein [Ancylobacter mangrovi]MCS0493851.1 DUF58 domain-containing protein [Ancylobacter mangrovi]MCS0501452.1 DUF58 domain-containing protein [Ancylobacter mangrovi]